VHRTGQAARGARIKDGTLVSAAPEQSQDRVAVGLDGHGGAPTSFNAPENHLGDDITRAEIMDYLNQTYGPVFVADLMERLASSRDGKEQSGNNAA
jgi:hypothetical protein